MKDATSRTLKYLRSLGYLADVVGDRWIPLTQRKSDAGGAAPAFRRAGKRKDAFGFVDIEAFTGRWTVWVQSTSAGGVSARVRKITAPPPSATPRLDDRDAKREHDLHVFRHEAASLWLDHGSRRIVVIGWQKTRPPKRKRAIWTPVIREVFKDPDSGALYAERGEV